MTINSKLYNNYVNIIKFWYSILPVVSDLLITGCMIPKKPFKLMKFFLLNINLINNGKCSLIEYPIYLSLNVLQERSITNDTNGFN